jgi:hypothetical protein
MPLDQTPGSATSPQKWKIGKLANERDLSQLNEEQRSWLQHPDNYNVLSKAKASEIIGLLLEAPMLQTQPHEKSPQASEVDSPDAGYYFIADDDTRADGKTESFYRVQKGKPGTRWEGYTFLAIQASDDFYAVKDSTRRARVFELINRDPINQMNEYGLKLGRCGMCNRTLTDRHSRLRGLGPICAGKIEASPDQIDLLTQLGLIDEEVTA